MPVKRKDNARQLRRMSRQFLVAVPPWAVRWLGAAPGVSLFWFRNRRGEVVLSARAQRGAGAPGRRDLEEELLRVTAERDEYRRSLTSQDLVEQREVYAGGVMQGLRIGGPILAQLEALQREVASLGAQLARLPGAGRLRPLRAVRSRRRRVEAVTLPDAIPSPSPAPSSESSGGAVASGGETPQATHV
jgi:hypothetical protein